jgi:hypothetical protein
MGTAWRCEVGVFGGLVAALLLAACGNSYSEEERGAYEMGYYHWADNDPMGRMIYEGEGWCEETASYLAVGSMPYPYSGDTLHLWTRGCKDAFQKNTDPRYPDPEQMAIEPTD